MWRFLNKNMQKEYSRMGFYSDQKGILRRYRRESKFWNIHNQNTRNIILDFVKNKPTNKIAILGSGWLLDIPVEELSKIFNEIWLFDIFHPKPVIRKYKSYKVFFQFTDLSCFALPVYHLCKTKKQITYDDLMGLKALQEFDLSGFDCVISCNIMDQLDELLLEFVKRKNKIETETELQFRTKIQNQHISILPKGKTLLICDQNEVSVNPANEVIDRKNLLMTHIEEMTYITDWCWKFDNTYMYNENYKTWFEVFVYEL
jgi:hypothetical protein